MDALLHSNAIWFVLLIVMGFVTLRNRRERGLSPGYGPISFFVMGGIGLILVALNASMK